MKILFIFIVTILVLAFCVFKNIENKKSKSYIPEAIREKLLRKRT